MFIAHPATYRELLKLLWLFAWKIYILSLHFPIFLSTLCGCIDIGRYRIDIDMNICVCVHVCISSSYEYEGACASAKLNVECLCVFVFHCLMIGSFIKLEVHHFVCVGQAVSSLRSAYLHTVILDYCYAQLFLGFFMTARDLDSGAHSSE